MSTDLGERVERGDDERYGEQGVSQTYVRLGHFYVNKDLSPGRLGRYLWVQADQFLGNEGKSRQIDSKWQRILPSHLTKGARIARQVARFLINRSGSSGETDGRRGDASLVLPVAGDFALARRSGAVKVLDVERNSVYTLIRDERQREKLRERVEIGRTVSPFPFAPSIHQVDLEGGYFSEEFLTGNHPQNFRGCGEDFPEIYQPLLVQFILSLPSRTVDSSEYVESLVADILDPDGLLQQLDEGKREDVREFVEELRDRLSNLDGPMPLVLSHGDFFSGNIVIEGSEHKAIDWANMGFRSPLHDLYYLYMNHCCRVQDQRELGRRSALAIERVREELLERNHEVFAELTGHLTASPRLRWLFYLECIQVPLIRSTEPDDRYLDSMLERVSWFKAYERSAEASVDAHPLGTDY